MPVKSMNKLQSADVVIFAGGISPLLEGESMRVSDPGFKGGDRTEIRIARHPCAKFFALLKKNGKKTVFRQLLRFGNGHRA